VAVLAGTGLAHAGPPDAAHTARLSYARGQGAERCPEEETLRAAVAARLGYDPFRPDASQTVTASIRHTPTRGGEGALRAEVRLVDVAGAVAGTRQLSAAEDDCADLVASMALAISIAIDPQSQLGPEAPRAVPPVQAPSSPPPGAPARAEPAAHAPALVEPPAPAGSSAVPAVVARPSPPPRARPPERPTWRVGVGAVIAAGAAPGISGGVTVQAGVRWKVFSGALEGRADPPAGMVATGGGTVHASLLTLTVLPCFHFGLAAACGRASFGAVLGSGADVPIPRNAATFFGSAGARLGVTIPLGARFAADLHGDLDVTYTRTNLDLYGGNVWTAPRAAAALGAGLLAHFP
jgi:hypothetical protein